MATQIVFGKSIAKCERCGHVWLPKVEPETCAKCRSPYWNREKIGIKADVIIYDDLISDKSVTITNEGLRTLEQLKKIKAKKEEIIDRITDVKLVKPEPIVAVSSGSSTMKKLVDKPIPSEPLQVDNTKMALQCAITNKFNCEYHKAKIPMGNICEACFKAPFWTNGVLIKKLQEAFSDEPDEEVENEDTIPEDFPEPDYDLIELEKVQIGKPVTNEPPAIIGGEPKVKDEYELNKYRCYTCLEKRRNPETNEWICTFQTYKASPQFDYCKICWELPEIWGDKAAGKR